MANLKESSFWEEGIYQWETSDPVLGGENGIDNVPTRQLANRTKWLKDNKLDKSATAASADLAKKAQVADKLSKARNVGGVAFDGTADIDLPGVNKPGNQDTSGNAATASYAAQIAARKIGGVIFNAKTDIDLPGVNIKGNQDTSGNAATATKLQAACKIGDVQFDGTADIDLPGVNKPGNQDTSGNAATASYAAQIAARKIGGVIFNAKTDIDLPGVNIKGNQDTSGNAATATRLQTICTINGVPFDGNTNINTTPAGAVQFFAMDTAPVGWLKANGAALSRTTYANLFAAIGTRFGEGDGSTTFNLPDLRGLFLRGWDDGRGLDKNRELGSWQIDGTISDKDKDKDKVIIHRSIGYSNEYNNKVLIEQNNLKQETMYKTNMASTAAFGSERPIDLNRQSEVRPLNVALLACIKI